MNHKRWLCSVAALLVLWQAGCREKVSEAEALVLGTQAYLYGFPLVVMDVTREVSTATEKVDGMRAPANQFAHVERFPDPSFTDVVRANVDTLYSVAWLDLTAEPVVLSVPDTGGRYYLMPILDAWSNVIASPGARTTGTGAGDYLIAGPNWKGTAPAGIKQEIRSSTAFGWVIGRTQTNGPKDYDTVHAIQKKYRLTPLSAFGQPERPAAAGRVNPSTDTKTPPIDQVRKMDAGAFFQRLALLLKDNPPSPADAPMVAKLAKLGIEPGKPFDITKVDAGTAAGLQRANRNALTLLEEAVKLTGKKENGWTMFPENIGRFGTDYRTRAAVALMGLGANTIDDAIYPTAFVDSEGRELDGTQRYVLHFEKGGTPPAQGFWSVTMYDEKSFFVPNAMQRQNLSAWMPLKYNADGSLDLYFQASSPGREKEANWLPAPAGKFNVTMRVYWPKQEMLSGAWKPPAIRKVQ